MNTLAGRSIIKRLMATWDESSTNKPQASQAAIDRY